MEGNFINNDLVFRNQLLDAIEIAVEELEGAYIKGIGEENLECIKQARHKIKPTLSLFGLKRLTNILSIGKKKLAEDGFVNDMDAHVKEFKECTQSVLLEVRNYR